jgi:hypothetical protein
VRRARLAAIHSGGAFSPHLGAYRSKQGAPRGLAAHTLCAQSNSIVRVATVPAGAGGSSARTSSKQPHGVLAVELGCRNGAAIEQMGRPNMSIGTVKKILAAGASALAVLLAFPSHAEAQQVQLLRGLAFVHHAEGLSDYQRSFDIRVQNIAFEKQVFVHHQQTDGTWTDIQASYVRNLDSGYELWRATFDHVGSGLGDQFAVGYTVNGNTYWDNNGGNNFVLHDNDGALLGTGINVKAFLANVSSNTLNVQVDVRNIAFQKSVQVVYTTDNWATTTTVDLAFVSSYTYGYATVASPNAIGFEHWTGSATVPSSSSLLFYVKYTVNGQTYYDNNFGANYDANAFPF